MKLCSDCSKEKDGNHPSYCKTCRAKRTAVYRQNNPEKVKESNKKYKQNNKEKIRESDKEYYQNNKEKVLERQREYDKNNLHKSREKERKRRALKKANIHEPYSEDQVLKLYGSVCHICKEEINLSAKRSTGAPGWERGLHIDHVMPLSKGGPDMLDNVRPAHGLCNLQKSASVL